MGRPNATAALAGRLALLAGGAADPAPDRELIDRFRTAADQTAFATLVHRHGPMVRGVCRRMLKDEHAADDAFQATFLVLSRKLSAVAWKESVGGWLYTVARHVCRKAQDATARNRPLPLSASDHDPPARESGEPTVSDLKAVLDEELARLPAAYRDAIVMCHLEGRTADEAAKALGCTDGQLRGRLHRGREKLRDRLAARGISLSAVTLGLLLSQAGAGAVPPAVLLATVQSAAAAAAGPLADAAAPAVVSLTEGVLRAMAHTKFRFAALSGLLLTGLTAGGILVRADAPAPAAPFPGPPAVVAGVGPVPSPAPFAVRADDDKAEVPVEHTEGVIKAVEDGGRKLVVRVDDQNADQDVRIKAGTAVTFARRKYTLADLRPGMRVKAAFRGNDLEAFELEAHWPEMTAVVKSLDGAKNAVTVGVETNGGVELDVSLPTLADVTVLFDELPAGLADVPTGKEVRIELAPDKKTVAVIDVQGDKEDLFGHVKSTDAGKDTLVLTLDLGGRQDRKVDVSFLVAAGAKFRASGKDAKLGELRPRMPVVVRLAADRRTVAAVWAGPQEPENKDDD